MNSKHCWRWTVPALLLPALAIAQAPPTGGPATRPDPATSASDTEADVEEARLDRLPDPLRQISSNILDLESTGYFSVVGQRLRVFGQEYALVFTVRAKRIVSYRHVTMQLHRFRDVRFYKALSRSRTELHSTLMYYSPRIDSGAADGRVLGRDNQFEVWVYLRPTTIRRLLGLNADTVEFTQPLRTISLGQ